MVDTEQREISALLDTYNAFKSLIPQLSDVHKEDKLAHYLEPLPANPLQCMTVAQLNLKVLRMQQFVQRRDQLANKRYNEGFLQLQAICNLPRHRTDASMREIIGTLNGDVARDACIQLWFMGMNTTEELKVKTMFAGLNECLLMRARESEQELRSELDALKNKRPDKKELRASEKALARLNVDLKAALENAAEQKKTVEQLSSQLSEKQVEVKRLQREISNGVRKLKKIVNGTPFSKTSQDEGSAKTSAFEALADFTAKFVESEKESKKQNAIKLAETEKAVLALQAKVSEAEEAFRQANEKHHKAHNTITQIEARIAEIECKVECGVCNERDVDVVFHCGHTMCHKCSEKVYLRGDNCPYCRRRIGYKKKLCLGS